MGADRVSWGDSGCLRQLWGLYVQSRGGKNLGGKDDALGILHVTFKALGDIGWRLVNQLETNGC